MAINSSYAVEMGIALPGMLSDTSAYNVDGACACDGDVPVGVAVSVTETFPVDGYKVVKVVADGAVAYGVAMRSHYQSPTGVYESGDAINVVSHGRIWMVCDDTTAPGVFNAPVKLVAGTGHVAAAGTINTGWTFAGGFTKWKDVNLVEVQLTQSAPVPATAG